MYKTPQLRSTFRSCDVEKMHSVVAGSTFRSQKCRKLDVEMSKKCTRLWREAHFQVKSVTNWGVRVTFWRSDVVSRGRRKGLWTLTKVRKTSGFCRRFSYNCNYNYNTLHHTTLDNTPLHYTTPRYTTLHYSTPRSTTLRYTSLQYTTLHSTTLKHTTPTTTTTATAKLQLQYTTLRYTTLRHTTLHYTSYSSPR